MTDSQLCLHFNCQALCCLTSQAYNDLVFVYCFSTYSTKRPLSKNAIFNKKIFIMFSKLKQMGFSSIFDWANHYYIYIIFFILFMYFVLFLFLVWFFCFLWFFVGFFYCHDITEILLKVAFNTIKKTNNKLFCFCLFLF